MKMNLQRPEKTEHLDGSSLDVIRIWSTIQGEGPYTGMPATFIRLAGCNLVCPLCDTDYTSDRRLMLFSAILESVIQCKKPLVVITGGEPFRQNITNLCSVLCGAGYLVQVETNGVIDPLDSFVQLKQRLNAKSCRLCVVCSPKTSRVSDKMQSLVDAWKYVVRDGEVEADGLPTSALGMAGTPARPTNDSQIYVQPLDEKDVRNNARNMQVAVDSCLVHGHRLCLQLHKIAGLD